MCGSWSPVPGDGSGPGSQTSFSRRRREAWVDTRATTPSGLHTVQRDAAAEPAREATRRLAAGCGAASELSSEARGDQAQQRRHTRGLDIALDR